MVLSIVYAALYIVLVLLFAKKERKTLPSIVRAAFMMGFPILAVLALLQAEKLKRKYLGRLFFEQFESTDDMLNVISVREDFVIPIIIGIIGAAFVIVGMLKVIKYPISEEPSQFSFGMSASSDAEYQKNCARSISLWGICIEVVSLLFGLGFIAYLGTIITDVFVLSDEMMQAFSVCMFMLFFGICLPFAFVFVFPLMIYFLVGTALMFFSYFLPQLVGIIICGFFCGLLFTAAAVIGVSAAVRMKKSGSITIGKTILYIIGSLVPIVNIFVLGNIRKTAR